jgi:hypothetical protein
MTSLGSRNAVGFLDPANVNGAGNWTVRFRPDDLNIPGEFEVYHISLRGPGGFFDVYIDDAFYSTAIRGDRNEYDPTQPMILREGQTVYFYWTIATGTAPKVWVYCRTGAIF